jgi:hypothetical protein
MRTRPRGTLAGVSEYHESAHFTPLLKVRPIGDGDSVDGRTGRLQKVRQKPSRPKQAHTAVLRR